ncbi:hypothetical protein [Shinella zoogloeoides]|uniref:hypothetical protein n=1 Tax=Shinella zoogloeoides TaxID=352475 RepID=UPI00273E6A55|nr:hypothetical protein [Shinella zoogloeoides]WLR93354.1 hypothetical protein Q9316_03890 [Shinella zoogloeoides]
MAFLLSGAALHRPSMGFRTTPVIVRRPQGLGGGSKVKSQEEPQPGGLGEAADPAERARHPGSIVQQLLFRRIPLISPTNVSNSINQTIL